jgi:ribonuclease HI
VGSTGASVPTATGASLDAAVKPIDDEALTIYTDGSSYSGPRRGGVGILYVTVDEDGHERVDEYPLPGYDGATNNQMELRACIDALKATVTGRAPVDASQYKKVVVRTDSMYVAENVYNARFIWPANGWMTRDGNPVLNAHLWKELVRIASRAHRRVEFEWIKGHKKGPPQQARRHARQGVGRGPDRPARLRGQGPRKRSDRSVEIGSVEMRGQMATIRIITDEYLPVQRSIRRRSVQCRRARFPRGNARPVLRSRRRASRR